MDQSDQSYIRFKNKFYEISFSKVTGEIAYIIDNTTKQQISLGNKEGKLWEATLSDGETRSSHTYVGAFSYEFDKNDSKLTFQYDGELSVTVVVELTGGHELLMQASVHNGSDKVLEKFSFPHELTVDAEAVEDGLVPMLPGALLTRGFFDAKRTFSALYPGVMFADYMGLRTAHGNLSVYGIRGDTVQPVNIGFRLEGDSDSDKARIIREFRTYGKEEWISPRIAIRVGQDYGDTIAGYRSDNRFDKFENLAAKLGEKSEAYFNSAMYKLDLERLGLSFNELKTEVVDQIQIPGMIHPVAFQQQGHDQSYPDFVPPDARWGTVDDFRKFTTYAQERGNLVVPYTNFSWWDGESRYMAGLSPEALQQATVKGADGLPAMEQYGPHQGYVVNPHDEYVKQTISEQHGLLMKEIGMDGIFEDQWGARTAPMDYHFAQAPTSGYDPSTAYFEGVLDHARRHKDNLLMTEVGIDMLAEHEVGFMGTNYLWDIAGYRKETADFTQYYPMIGMLARDKVLLYQHDLAADTWTDDKEMFRWNLAQGYQFSGEIASPSSLEFDSWLQLIGVFQKYALSRYADELVTGFERVAPDITQTKFETFQVVANWNEEDAYPWEEHVISKGGAALASADGTVTGGVFDAYNGVPLDTGEHYLLEVRSQDEVKVFQPVGWATSLSVKLPKSWNSGSVISYTCDGEQIGKVESHSDGDMITFKYKSLHEQTKVGYYTIVKEH
ncbi:DUF6259 domain-containing protein [Paenibacillus pinihumi]|uniref:DUF6259 domain-containing protein n=1 Tax=Paenibacillus pinihumi TaxID=669462 RepID=UPI001FDFDBD8|nr:DUF6259 domain-containing protein [Paenibacillus pinihumi]